MGSHREPGTGWGRIAGLALAAVVALLLAGCATTSDLPGHPGVAHARQAGQDGPPASAAELGVVRRWAAELRAGDIRAAAAYFQLPSRFNDGAATVVIRTLAQAEIANSTLSCGAVVISAFRTGRLIDVLFRLTARAGPGGGRQACGTGIGQTARTDFLIRNGRIVEWLRAASLPGDPNVPGSPPSRRHHAPSGGGQSGGASLPA